MQQPYYTPPPRRRSSAWIIGVTLSGILGIVVLFGGCVAVVIAAGRPSNVATPPIASGPADATTGPAARKKSDPKGARIGQPAKDGKFTFTVTKVERGPARIGDQYFGTKPQGKFIFVRVTVLNHGDKPQSFFGDNQRLMAAGKQYSADSEASIYLEDSQSLYEEINPGNTVKGTIVYDVPKSVTPEAIELHDSAFSGGVKVSLR